MATGGIDNLGAGADSSVVLDSQVQSWLSVGIAIHLVATPVLREYVAELMEKMFSDVKENQQVLRQKYGSHYDKVGDQELNYRNINGNVPQAQIEDLDYYINDHLDFAKLFWKPGMPQLSSFSQSDKSVCEMLIDTIIQSKCIEAPEIEEKAKRQTGVVPTWVFAEKMMVDLYRRHKRDLTALLQTYGHQITKAGNCKLYYKNINDNGRVRTTPLNRYDYNIRSTVDFARLFLESDMTNFSFNEADASALFGLIIAMDQKEPSFVQNNIYKCAIKLQEIRIEWANCIPDQWDQSLSSASFNAIQTIFQTISGFEVKAAMKKLKDIQSNVMALGWEKSMQSLLTVSSISTSGVAVLERINAYLNDTKTLYVPKLCEFHEDNLQSLAKEQPYERDISCYVRLKVAHDDTRMKDSIITAIHAFTRVSGKGESINPENLFQGDVRTVVLAGVPGSGKSITSQYILKRIIHGEIFKDRTRLVFFIKIRDLNPQAVSLKDLLLAYHGPSISKAEKDTVWLYMDGHQDEVMVILDGYDEATSMTDNCITFTSVDQPQTPQVLLYNLIKGTLLKYTKILVTTRPHCLDHLWDYAYRKRIAIIEPLNVSQINNMVDKSFVDKPNMCKGLVSLIEENEVIRNICSVPVNARNLIDYTAWVHRDLPDTDSIKDEVLKNQAAFLFVLILKILQTSDRTMPFNSRLLGPEEVLGRRKVFLQKICELASGGIFDDTKQSFSVRDIKVAGLTIKDLEGSFMTCYKVLVQGSFGPEIKQAFMFPHLTQQEHFAGLHLSMKPLEEVLRLARGNNRQHDNILKMFLGICGNTKFNQYLPLIFSGIDSNKCVTRARIVLKAVGESGRPFDCTIDANPAVDICTVSERHGSQQWDMVSDLLSPFTDHRGICHLPCMQSSSETNELGSYFQVVQPQVLCLSTRGSLLKVLEDLPCSRYTALDVSRLPGENLEPLLDLLTDVPAIWLTCDGVSPLSWARRTFSSLQCARLDMKDIAVDMYKLCSPLIESKHLDTLFIKYPMLFPPSYLRWHGDLTPLWHLRALKHLTLQNVPLTDTDIYILSILLLKEEGLTWLHLYGIEIQDLDIIQLSECLASDQCMLDTLRLEKCNLSTAGYSHICTDVHLTSLELSYCDAKLPPLCSLLQTSETLTELDLKMSSITDLQPLTEVLCSAQCQLKVLDLSDNAIGVESLSKVINRNTSLQTLLLNGCDLDDESVGLMISPLQKNITLKTLSLCSNAKITKSSTMAQLLSTTGLEVIDMRYCGPDEMYSSDSQCCLAQALASSSTLQVFGYGQHNETLTPFMQEVCRCYPDSGPLQAVYLHTNDQQLMKKTGLSLASRLRVSHLVRFSSDPASDTGRRWRALPADRRYWLLSIY